MAFKVIIDPVVTIGGTNYDSVISSFAFPISRDNIEATNFNSAGDKEYVGGLRSYPVNVTFRKDADMSGLDLAAWTAIQADDNTLAWTAKADSDATDATNPLYSGSLLVSGWTPIGGAVGAGHEESVTWQGTGAITRATS